MLFARAPTAGGGNTALAAAIGADAASRLRRAFVADAIDVARSIPGVDVELHIDAPCEAWIDESLVRRLQIPGDRGARLLNALRAALEGGYSPAAAIDAELPTVPASCITTMLASTCDVVFGPTEDGGFYAVSASKSHPDMFAGVQWSAESILAQCVASVSATGLTVALGPVWFNVRNLVDLERFNASPVKSPRARAVLDELGLSNAAANGSD